jgi:hypothetical protein
MHAGSRTTWRWKTPLRRAGGAAGPSDAERAFEAAGIAVKTLAKPPGNDELLALYAFYKQATVGDATTGMNVTPRHDAT